MTDRERAEIVLETLRRVNRSLDSDPNALISSRESRAAAPDPEAAYIELVLELLKLTW